MNFLLQPDLERVENPAVPPESACGAFFTYPTPSSENYCCRPSTMVYGTAPYMAGKGAPNELIMVEDELRPQSTTRFGKVYMDTYAKSAFPLQDVSCAGPQRTPSGNPMTTRGVAQNVYFSQRYLGK